MMMMTRNTRRAFFLVRLVLTLLKSPDVDPSIVKATRDETFFFSSPSSSLKKSPVAAVDDFVVVVAVAIRAYG